MARNRAKRVLRAAAAEVGVAPGTDVALVARRGTGEAGTTVVAAELRAHFPDGIRAVTRVAS